MTGWRPDWDTLIPDPDRRLEWQVVFGDNDLTMAAGYATVFTDALTAYAWRACHLGPDLAHTLHTHNITPDRDTIRLTYAAACREAADGPNPGGLADADLRVALTLIHPHLTREDRDTITAAGLTITEVDNLITTGTYDRTTLATLAGLT